jgi:anti-sigma factor RsiW
MNSTNPCLPFESEIAEVALGSYPGEALSLHLAQCDSCAAELARQRALVRRFAATLGTLAQPEPPADVVENVLARVRAGQRPATPLPRQRFANVLAGRRFGNALAGRRFAAALAGVAIAASLIVFVFRFQGERSGVTPAQTAALTAWRSPTLSLLENHESVLRAPLGASRFSLERRPVHS